MSTNDLNQMALALHEAQLSRQPIQAFGPKLAEGTTAANGINLAYQIQALNIERAVQAGERIVGRKIGLTSLAVQAQLGVSEPDFGTLLASMAFGTNQELDFHQWIQPKAEAEIALVLNKDLSQTHNTLADIISATDYVLPAIEIVDSRVKNWEISIYDTVADNASAAAFVLGATPKRLDQVDLERCAMVMERQGDQVSIGAGNACLGHPLNAAVWLANTMAQQGTPLKAGDIVLTGALGPMVTVQAGDALHVNIEGLGQVSALFSR